MPEKRRAVVDLGSNSVRLVVFEGDHRNPVAIFNEKATLRLGSGLTATGRLNDAAVAQAVRVMARYGAIAQCMHAAPMAVLATAAVRDAANGAQFVQALRDVLPGVAIRILSGEEEAAFSADGVLCGIPDAHGILADIGGGSLELVRLDRGRRGRAVTLKLGVIRLAERAEGDLARARKLAETELEAVDWIRPQCRDGGCDMLYLVGGAFRALARVHMAQRDYPLNIVHHYAIDAEEGRALAAEIIEGGKRGLERLPSVSRRRGEDLPYAAVALRRLIRVTGARRLVFSANGLREGWYMQQVPEAVRQADPLLAAAGEIAAVTGRDPTLPPALIGWTAPLFPDETDADRRLREAACWMSDAGSHDHPEYRAEQAFLRITRQPGIALDHPDRAFLGVALAFRYEADPDSPYLAGVPRLLSPELARRAEQLGLALRLAYTISAGTPALLAASSIAPESGRLVLRLVDTPGVFAREGVTRRLNRLATALGWREAVLGTPIAA